MKNHFNIILTEHCNANCSHCYMDNKNKTTLTREQIDKIIDKISRNTKSVTLTGGEVFICRDLLYYMIKKIHESVPDIKIEIESNGIYLYNLDNPVYELKKLKQLGVTSIRFSDDPFHEIGGINLKKVRDLKKLESDSTPIIKYLCQTKAVAIGKAENLNLKQILKANCMNKLSTKNEPYYFLDIDGNVYLCPWKCSLSVGNIFSDALVEIEENIKSEINKYILIGNIEEAISFYTNIDLEIINKEAKENGQCYLCKKYFKR